MIQTNRTRTSRAFSIAEMLIALTISATLLTATLVALDACFKRYTVITDSASTHLIARTVIHRITSLVRTGTDFAPYPYDVLDATQNPMDSSFIEFVSERNVDGVPIEITRIERRYSGNSTINGEDIALRGQFSLWQVTRRGSPATSLSTWTREDRPILDGVVAANFNLEFDVGPKLVRVTIDLTVLPCGNTFDQHDGTRYTKANAAGGVNESVAVDSNTETIRLVASASPRGY